MQLSFVFVFFLFTLARSSNVESDMLSSVDIVAFRYSQQVSQHWDCPRISDRAGKAEEVRIWQSIIPDARIEETVSVSASKALRRAEEYKWIKDDMHSSGSTMAERGSFVQNCALLGMRKPSFDGGATLVKVLCSMSKQVNQDAPSVVLQQLEQSKDKIMDWIIDKRTKRAQLTILEMVLDTPAQFVDDCRQMLEITNYHPRIFKHPHFTTGDLVAWMTIAAGFCRKSCGDRNTFMMFETTLKMFLPKFDIILGAVPASCAGKPTQTVYLPPPFRYVPAGTDLAFYFDGNRGKFLSLARDSIMLTRPEGIVDGQKHSALVLALDIDAMLSDLRRYQTESTAAIQRNARQQVEKQAIDFCRTKKTIDPKVRALGMSMFQNILAQVERDSFLEARRRLLESFSASKKLARRR